MAGVVVNPTQGGAAISSLVLGANLAIWYDITQSGVASSLKTYGFRGTRWPGGEESDTYHWQTNTMCNGYYVSPHDTFDNFMTRAVKPAGLDAAITVNYGSNSTCDGPGDPVEAAAWVSYALASGYAITHWTVGNEVFGSWEYDLHAIPHDAATYANAVATGYYPLMKAANPNAQVGVVVSPGWTPDWDSIVLSQAKYDFVELHYYPQQPGQESDTGLLTQGPAGLTAEITLLNSELAAAGRAGTPIFVGEIGSVSSRPGKQTTSITQALYAGMAMAELMNDGVGRAAWWLAYGGCTTTTHGNFSSSLYGWQTFGGYMIFSDGLPEGDCPKAAALARGTPLPTVRAFQLLSEVAGTGDRMLGVTLNGSYPNLRAYAMTAGSGYALLLFNLSETAALSLPVSISGVSGGYGATISTYGKAQYDLSKNNVWAGPVSQYLGPWRSEVTVQLPVWSMTVLTLP
jgi:hypothetical protein